MTDSPKKTGKVGWREPGGGTTKAVVYDNGIPVAFIYASMPGWVQIISAPPVGAADIE